MKRGLVLVALSLVVVLSIALVSASFFSGFFSKITGKQVEDQTCMDSDGGLNLNVTGAVTFVYSNGAPVTIYYPGNDTTVIPTFTDYCSGENVVAESRCYNNALTINNYNCPTGYLCSNGACVVNNNLTCSDNDGGISPNTIGTTLGRNDSSNYIQTDSCYSTTGLYEFYCTNEASPQIAYVAVNCSSGYSCANGACGVTNTTNSSNVTCTDSDGGQNAGVRGTTIGMNGSGLRTQTDSCYSPTGIYEFYCFNNQIAVTSLNCSSGYLCVNSVCNVTNTTGAPRGGDTNGSISSGGGGGGGSISSSEGGTTGTSASTTTSPTTISGETKSNNSVVISSSGGSGAAQQTNFSVSSQSSTVTGSSGIVAVSSVQISTSEGKAYATNENGSKQEIKIDPTTAINSVNESIKSGTFGEVRMIEYQNKIVYEIDVTKKVKVIALIPANMSIIAKVDVEEGNIISVKKPWWNFLAKEI